MARAHARRRRLRIAVSSIIGVVVLLAAAVALGASARNGAPAKTSAAGSPLLAKVTGVPTATTEEVGSGGTGQSLLGLNSTVIASGKPKVVYIGAEYCPFCAAERWPVVQALSRFGTWVGLKTSASATDDVFPGTATFSFQGATYTSRYLSFEGVETHGNVRVGGSYPLLQALTPEQRTMLETYNAPPYVPAKRAGGIPFVNYGGRFATAGADYDPEVLVGMTATQIADALSDPATSQAKAILGAANRLTAALCALTGGQPSEVCQAPAVTALAKQLPSGR